jgi:phosphate transport system permease protein
MNAIAQPVAAPSTRDARDARNDKLFRWVLVGTVIFVLIALACAALSMLWGGRHALQMQGLSFFFSADWNPVENKFGALAPIYGTLVTAVIAMVIAVPVSFGIAFFLTEVAPRWLRGPVGTAIELLAGIPSIIYGMWGLFVLVPVMTEYVTPFLNETLGEWPIIGPLFQGPPLGIGMLTAGFVLAIMVIPFISSVMREVFLTVPTRLKESAYALGSTVGSELGHRPALHPLGGDRRHLPRPRPRARRDDGGGLRDRQQRAPVAVAAGAGHHHRRADRQRFRRSH